MAKNFRKIFNKRQKKGGILYSRIAPFPHAANVLVKCLAYYSKLIVSFIAIDSPTLFLTLK